MQKGIWALLFVSISCWAVKPGWRFQVLETPHFEIIYRDTQLPLAKRYAVAAERVRKVLLPIFKEAPDKTIILISDDTDLSNGSADFLPYPMITVYPVLPGPLESIGDYGDWPYELIMHEYTHILNMYPAHGFYVPLHWLFGDIIRPNAVLPRWYLEGLAVEMETLQTHHGRLRSTQTQAAARAVVLGQHLRDETLATSNQSDLTTWPYGSRPYLFGSWWWDYVRRQKGTTVIYELNQDFSKRLPFLLNGPVRDEMNLPAWQVLDKTKAELTAKVQAELKTIDAAGASHGTRVASESGEQNVFALSPSGQKLIYWVGSVRHGTPVYVKERKTEGQPFSNIKAQFVFHAVGTSRVEWLDENRVVFDQIDRSSPYTSFRDLYIYDLAKRKLTRLTYGARAQDATVSIDGKQVVFIQNESGKTNLVALDLGTRALRPLLKGNFKQRFSSPVFLNASEVLFSVRLLSGLERLYVYNLATKKARIWNRNFQSAHELRRTPAGILLSDDKTGVRNIYLIRNGHAEPITNSETEIGKAVFDPQLKQLIASQLTPKGRRLFAFAVAEQKPPTLKRPVFPPPPPAPSVSLNLKPQSYQPIEYLFPHYWIPFVYQVENGWLFQGMTSTSDPVGRNSYTLLGSIDTVTKKPSYGVDYVNRSLPTRIGLSYEASHTFLSASQVELENQMGALNFSQNWPFNSRDADWTVGGLWQKTHDQSDFNRLGPAASFHFSDFGDPLAPDTKFEFDVSLSEFLKSRNYLAYGRSYVHFAAYQSIGDGHLLLDGKAAFAPRMPFNDVVLLGDSSLGGNYMVNLTDSNFLLRGYPSGTFTGRKVLNANLEYAFAPDEIMKGWGIFPWFISDLEPVLFADVMAVDGAGFRTDLNVYARTHLAASHWAYGGELRLHTTAAYYLPMSLTFGLYNGVERKYGGGLTTFVGLALGELGKVD